MKNILLSSERPVQVEGEGVFSIFRFTLSISGSIMLSTLSRRSGSSSVSSSENSEYGWTL